MIHQARKCLSRAFDSRRSVNLKDVILSINSLYNICRPKVESESIDSRHSKLLKSSLSHFRSNKGVGISIPPIPNLFAPSSASVLPGIRKDLLVHPNTLPPIRPHSELSALRDKSGKIGSPTTSCN